MKTPWRNRTGLAKAAALLATILVIAIGLCGANFFLVISNGEIFGPPATTGPKAWLANVLGITAYIELIVMAICALGLILIALIAASRAIRSRFTHN